MTDFGDVLRAFGDAQRAGEAVRDLEQTYWSTRRDPGLIGALDDAAAAYRAAAERCEELRVRVEET